LTVTYKTASSGAPPNVGDGRRFDNALRIWEVATGKERLTIPCTTSGPISHVVMAPDGRTLAIASKDRTIRLWDLNTGAELLSRVTPDSPVSCLAFGPNCRSLASGHADGTIFVWDLKEAGGKKSHSKAQPDERQVERWWADLADNDSRKANAAIQGLSAAPELSIRLFRERLRPVAEAPKDKLLKLIADLDSADFARRQAATAELTVHGEAAGPALRTASKASQSPEQRRRIEQILAALNVAPSGQRLRHVRAAEALELIGSDAARRVLETWAEGVSEAVLTQEAQSSLNRLAARPVSRD